MNDDGSDIFSAARNNVETSSSSIHSRVMRIESRFVLVCWDTNADLQALHNQLKPLIEGALLSELCLTPKEALLSAKPPTSLALVCYGENPNAIESAVKAFGLQRQSIDGDTTRELFARVRAEAQRAGRSADEEPTAIYSVRIDLLDNPNLDALDKSIAQALVDKSWGQNPGEFYAAMAGLQEPAPQNVPDASLQSVDETETLFVSKAAGVMRWISPMLFQSLCDQLAVVAKQAFGVDTQWAESETDESGFTTPPLIRSKIDGAWVHIPLGLHVLRWCVLPLQRNEEPAKLSEWVSDQFGHKHEA